jgi:uncharacterized protein with HEPN domain
LFDVVDACQRIERFIEGKSLSDFLNDELLFDGVVRNLQIVGEAVRCLPDTTRALRPDVEWSRIVGLRNLLVHQYFGIDEEVVWDLAVHRCPELAEAAADMVDRLPTDESDPK